MSVSAPAGGVSRGGREGRREGDGEAKAGSEPKASSCSRGAPGTPLPIQETGELRWSWRRQRRDSPVAPEPPH